MLHLVNRDGDVRGQKLFVLVSYRTIYIPVRRVELHAHDSPDMPMF